MVRVGRSCRSNELIFFLDESEDFFLLPMQVISTAVYHRVKNFHSLVAYGCLNQLHRK